MNMGNLLKELGEISIQLGEHEHVVALLVHSANQQSILLDAVLAMLEKGMDVKQNTSPNTCGIEFDRKEQNM